MADEPEGQAAAPPQIVAGSAVYFNEKSPLYLTPENARPMAVQEMVNAGASAVCTRDAQVVGTYPIEELRLSTDVLTPLSPVDDDEDYDIEKPHQRKKYR